MAVSDVLFEAEEAIQDYQCRGVIAEKGDPELELVLDVMRAVRMLPGRDRPPDEPCTFKADLARALVVYEDACRRRDDTKVTPAG